MDQLNSHEIQRITQFQAHLLSRCDALSWDGLLAALIQRRQLSLSIVNVYEFVIDALEDEPIKAAVRLILHEEFPRNTKGVALPSHRELLFQDLLKLGATRQQILTTEESEITHSVRHESQQQLMDCLSEPHHQLALICYLRFWAEVLVSVEYACLWPRLSERLSHGDIPDRSKSEFFYYHMIHDSRQSDIGTDTLLGGLTHAQELARQISKLIPNEEALACAMRQVDQACALKSRFYDQFLPRGSGHHAPANRR
ncbi:hypothetical protein KQ305_02325 [Synechococcus sp. CS-1332]|nr:hypothetical protein [Synechococcus sp. CS-1332]